MATLTSPIPVLLTEEQRGRIKGIAGAEGISMALVVRELIDAGLVKREKLCWKRTVTDRLNS